MPIEKDLRRNKVRLNLIRVLIKLNDLLSMDRLMRLTDLFLRGWLVQLKITSLLKIALSSCPHILCLRKLTFAMVVVDWRRQKNFWLQHIGICLNLHPKKMKKVEVDQMIQLFQRKKLNNIKHACTKLLEDFS